MWRKKLLVVAMSLSMLLPMGVAVGAPPDQAPADVAARYQEKAQNVKDKADKKFKTKDLQQAAARSYQKGRLNPLMVDAQAAALAAPVAPGDAPHYFSHPNYANSPLPTVEGSLVYSGNPLVDRQYASDYPVPVGELAPVFVVVPTALPEGFLSAFQTWNQATPGGSDFASAGNIFHAYVLRPGTDPNEYTVMFDSGQLTVPGLTDPTTSEVATFGVTNLAVQAGDVLAFYGQGIPVDTGSGTDVLSYPALTPPLQGTTITLGGPEYPIYPQARTYSFGAQVIDPAVLDGDLVITGGMRKFVDELPSIPAATPGTWSPAGGGTDPTGADFYEIGLVQYEQQMHADLVAPTLLRGYVQLIDCASGGDPLFNTLLDGTQVDTGYCSLDAPSYLGPAIVAQKDKPVRILFRNLLPTGADGNLFIPVDSTVMGSGMTPDGHALDPTGMDPLKPMCSEGGKDAEVAAGNCYADNRAVVHLHGGITPWISDGTPHQWITPAGENTAYPEGVSVENVPDMGMCEADDDGCVTLFYTNQQSARLMFYHDHAWGITRLNVYAGMAAPYIITDETEQALLDASLIPGAADTIPLVVQDKTFVPSSDQLLLQDETWDTTRWGDEGDLWVPHVYSPAQNPGDASGVNEFGRWAYGPWFWPPTNSIEFGPIDNPYYLPPPSEAAPGDPSCDPDVQWCEPALMPGTPFNSMGMESFNDTPTVNGTAYPTLTVDPKAYRFRILNAANDRFFNLSLYQAMDANGAVCDDTNLDPAAESTGVACTEVMLNPAEVEAALTDPAGVFPTPVVGTEGPEWIQIASEGGFLPAPAVIPAHPTTWVTDPTVFNAGNVDQHSLLMAPAERTDVIVDFSQYAGQTLILYNDAPAAFPARDPRYDYYTGNPDLRDIGGAPSTLPGYGPNTRTVMQIKVAAADPAPAFDLTALEAAFFDGVDVDGNATGVFETGQNPIHVGQGAYNSAYGTGFSNNSGLVQIYDTSITFDRLVDPDADLADPLTIGPPYVTSTAAERLTISLRGKMIQDEMGEAFEHEYGRMSGFLGVETPNAQAGLQNMILHPYTFPPTEILDGVELPAGTEMLPITQFDDGTQIWKITHNGVDTHPIHFHLYDVQLINRVGWDGIIRKPEANELGWKDTVRVSPLEDTIVAMRPVIPQLPESWQGDQGLPNSIRLLDPSMIDGADIDNTTKKEAVGGVITAFNPDGEPVDVINHYVNFGWEYVLHCHILSHEEMDMMHAQAVGIAPAAPTFDNATGAVRSGSGKNQQYALTWMDNSTNETGFVIERRIAGSTADWQTIATVLSSELGTPGSPLGTVGYVENGVGPGVGTRTWVDLLGNDKNLYEYQVYAINVIGDVWDYSDPALNNIQPGGGFPTLRLDSRDTGAPGVTVLAKPTGLTGSAAVKNKKTAIVTLNWTDNADLETGYLVQRADNALFSQGVVNSTLGANAATFDQTVARGRTYYYRVYAFSDSLQSEWSNTATVTTP